MGQHDMEWSWLWCLWPTLWEFWYHKKFNLLHCWSQLSCCFRHACCSAGMISGPSRSILSESQYEDNAIPPLTPHPSRYQELQPLLQMSIATGAPTIPLLILQCYSKRMAYYHTQSDMTLQLLLVHWLSRALRERVLLLELSLRSDMMSFLLPAQSLYR